MSSLFVLADCNNFYVSCERTFNPKLAGKPVVVLSNNDGCVIARSNEAKALGIVMGNPLFKIQDIVKKRNNRASDPQRTQRHFLLPFGEDAAAQTGDHCIPVVQTYDRRQVGSYGGCGRIRIQGS